MLPDLGSLALFVRAAETRNLTRAAEASCITVPAASRRLALLEHQMKAQLFERHSRGLDLTPAGERLLLLARDVIADLHHIHAEMANYSARRQTVLRVLGNTSAMAQFLLADIAAFQVARADVRVVLGESWTDDAIRRVRAAEIDLAVTIAGGDETGLCVRPYRHDRLAVVVRHDDPLTGDEVSFAELLERDLVGLESSSSLTRLLESHAAQLQRPMALRVQVRSFEAVCRAIEARFGIGVLPMTAARTFVHAMGLRVLPLSDPWSERRMSLLLRAEPAPDSPLAALADYLERCGDAK